MNIWTDKPMNLEEALEYMTDHWIEDGQYCDQTVMDLRDACRSLLVRRNIMGKVSSVVDKIREFGELSYDAGVMSELIEEIKRAILVDKKTFARSGRSTKGHSRALMLIDEIEKNHRPTLTTEPPPDGVEVLVDLEKYGWEIGLRRNNHWVIKARSFERLEQNVVGWLPLPPEPEGGSHE